MIIVIINSLILVVVIILRVIMVVIIIMGSYDLVTELEEVIINYFNWIKYFTTIIVANLDS